MKETKLDKMIREAEESNTPLEVWVKEKKNLTIKEIEAKAKENTLKYNQYIQSIFTKYNTDSYYCDLPEEGKKEYDNNPYKESFRSNDILCSVIFKFRYSKPHYACNWYYKGKRVSKANLIKAVNED